MIQLSTTQIVAPREPVLGYFHGEPIFPRRNVRQLYSSGQWSERFNRRVRGDEEPLRRLTLPKRNRTGDSDEAIVVKLYAEWQTDQIDRQLVGTDGKIPCTEFGNVNLIGAVSQIFVSMKSVSII